MLKKAILLYFLLSYASSQAIELSKVKFATLNYCPLVCDPKSEPNGRKGILHDILDAIFEREGIKVEITLMPFKRAIKDVEKGIYHGFVGGDQSQAPKLLFPKYHLVANRAQIFALRTLNWTYRGLSSLKEIKLLSVKEFSYANNQIEKYLEFTSAEKVTRMSGGESYTKRAISLLKKGDVDAYIDGHLVFNYIAGLQGNNKLFKQVSPTLGTLKNYVSFSPRRKNSKELMNIIDRNMPKLISDGTYKKILKRYYVKGNCEF